MTQKQKIVLPADIYDTLEFSALAFGGIGRDDYGNYTTSDIGLPRFDGPVCIIGHSWAAAGVPGPDEGMQIDYALRALGIDEEFNDNLFKDDEVLLTWPQYTKRAGIVRGE